MGGRFVLTLKDVGKESETAKARYVAQGFNDTEKDFVVHNAVTLRHSSVRTVLSFSVIKGYRFFAHDVKQAYLQSDEDLTRDIFIKPKAKDRVLMGVCDDQILKLKRPVYGTCDANDYWALTIDRNIKRELEMNALVGDKSLYIRNDKDGKGILGQYVDDGLMAGDENFQLIANKTLKRFESKERKYDEFDFLVNIFVPSQLKPPR